VAFCLNPDCPHKKKTGNPAEFQEGITHCSDYHRALLYFFGPYIEISVLVPEDRTTDAKEVIENYLDANVLTAQIQ
jgi:hypothetical protein